MTPPREVHMEQVQEYPKTLYSKDGQQVVVNDMEEEAQYKDWADSPLGPFEKPAKAKR